MPKKKAASKAPSAGARMKAAGRTLVWATFDVQGKRRIRLAAAASGVSMSQFVQQAGLAAAETILEKMELSV